MPLLFHVTVLKTCQLADGASVMIGKHNGVSTKLKLIDPVLIRIHCNCTLPEEIPSLPMPDCLHLSLIFGFFKCLPFHVCLVYSSETWLHY